MISQVMTPTLTSLVTLVKSLTLTETFYLMSETSCLLHSTMVQNKRFLNMNGFCKF